MDKKQAIEIAEQYAKRVLTHLPALKIVLFGSQAKGISSTESDIDIAVIVDKLPEDYLATSAFLFKLRRQLDDRIEPVLIEIDNDQSGFLEDILTTGYVVYESRLSSTKNIYEG